MLSLRYLLTSGLLLRTGKAFTPGLPPGLFRRTAVSVPTSSSFLLSAMEEAAAAAAAEEIVVPDSIAEPVFPAFVTIHPDADAVGQMVRTAVRQAAQDAIAERGHFCLALPDDRSIMKLLVGLGGDDDDDWTYKTSVVFVNFKEVDWDDGVKATHHRAQELFFNKWTGASALILDSTQDGADGAAARYQARLQIMPENELPRAIPSKLPVFDMVLMGVGDDGHIGSLHPHRPELYVGKDGPWVLPVVYDKKPSSITLSFPVMTAARSLVVAACGVSDKDPAGKAESMRRAIAEPNAGVEEFPAVGLRLKAKWILDQAAASKLGDDYKECNVD